MKNNLLGDASKKINSVLFRICLVFLGLTIIAFNVNYFPIFIYITGIIIYFILFFIFKNNKKGHSSTRLAIDYIFITLILYDKNVNTFSNACLVIMPIANSINHTDKSVKYINTLKLYLVCIASLYVINRLRFDIMWIPALLALAFVNVLIKIKELISRFEGSISNSIIHYYTNNVKVGNVHIVLNNLLHNWSSNSLFKLSTPPTRIVCFRKQNDRLKIITSSKFVTNYAFLNEKTLIQELQNIDIVKNCEVLIDDNTKIKPNVCLQITGANSKYLFYIEFIKNIDLKNPFNNYAISIIEISLFQVIKLIENEGTLKKQRKQIIDKMKDKLEFVEKTIKVVHFFNNRLSPIANYFEMIEAYKNLEEGDIKSGLLNIINKEEKRAKDSLLQITTRAKSLLEKSANPTVAFDYEIVKLKRIIAITRTIWDEHNLSNELVDIQWGKDQLNSTISIDVDSFMLAMEEVVTNTRKYMRDLCLLRFYFQDGQPVISIVNDVKPVALQAYRKNRVLQKQFNDNNINEILKRTSHGAHVIKKLFNELSIESQMEVARESFAITLIFPKHEGNSI